MTWKLLEGRGYCTLEWASMNKEIREKDIEELRVTFSRIPPANKVTIVIPAASPQCHCISFLREAGLRKVKEREVYYKDLREITVFPEHSMEFVSEPPIIDARRCLSSILGNPREANRILEALHDEIHPDKYRIYLVRKNGKDAGLCIPHIEPYTESEGRIFFFGITPLFRGQGLAATVHKFASASLRLELRADDYFGATDWDNRPMKKVFLANGCTKIQTIEVYSH
jgi:RimJ/RimL family protein N-acetyltransferase